MTDATRDVVIMLHDDKNTVRLGIVERRPGEKDKPLAWHDFDAAGLSNVIVHLGRVRAQMNDKVPLALDPGKTRIDVTVGAASSVGNEGPMAKQFVLGLRHPGYGWLGFAWNESDGKSIATLLMREILRMSELPRGIIKPGPGVKI